MKNIKKVLSVILCVSLLLSMQVFALEFKDVTSDNKNSEAIDVLSSLGIIKGYEDGVFMPEKTITRAEMTTLLMRLLNLSISGTSVLDSGYTDVANNHWAVYDIKTASTMKIINGYGGGLFGPEDSVTYEQAVKMVVCMLGYEIQALDKGGWPDGYIAQARDLGILKGAQMAQSEPAPRGIIAQILYNSLEVDLMAQKNSLNDESKSYYINYGHNLMTDYMRLEKIEGMVTANSKTRLDNLESQLSDDEIEITQKGVANRYIVGNFYEAKDMIGLSIIAYVKYDDYNINKIIQHMMPKSNIEKIEISTQDETKDIVSFDSSELRVLNENTGRTTDYKISDSAVYMYNGKSIDKDYLFEEDLAIPEIGSVTLVGSGSEYDYIEIESYKNYVVKSVDSSEYLIYLDNSVVNTSEATLYVPVDKTIDYSVSIKKNDKDIALSSIKKGNIISVKKTIPEEQVGIQNIEVLVSDNKATGKITEEDESYVKIENKEYSISASIKGTELGSKIVYGQSGTFYLDSFGEIAYAEFTAGGTYKYGYVINAAGDESEASIKIFDYNTGTVKILDFHTRVKINGGDSETDFEKVLAALEEAASKLEDASGTHLDYAQPIKYILNNQGKITDIITVKSTDDETMQGILHNVNSVYYSTNKYFDVDDEEIRIDDSKTVIIEVPLNRSDSKGYAKRSVSYFKNKYPYEIHAIGETESGYASIILAYEPNVDKDVYYNTPAYIVKDKKVVSVDGDDKTRLTLINFQTGAESTAYCANASYVKDVEVGDVIRFGKETNGDINKNVYIYLDMSEAKDGNHPKVVSNKGELPSKTPVRSVVMDDDYKDPYKIKSIKELSSAYAYVYATPYTVSENSFELTDLIPGHAGFATDEDEDGIFDKPTSIRSFAANSSTMFYTINSSNEITVIKGVSSDENPMGQIFSYKEYPDSNDYVYTFIINDSLKAVYIIKVD